MENYKIDIANTRKGCLGGSDGKILQSIAENGNIPKSALKRLAVCKGLIEVSNPTTRAMEYGDFIEQSVYAALSAEEKGYESNPLWVSEKFSKKNVKLVCHPDFVLVDSDSCLLKTYECKTTKFSVQETIENYKAQLFIEQTIAQEKACKMGKNWKVKVFLVHYDSSSQDMDDVFVFDTNKISIHDVTQRGTLFDVGKAMAIVDDFLETYDTYCEDDEIPYEYLPSNVKQEFNRVTTLLAEIKEREDAVNEFKAKLYSFLVEKNIKGIKNDSWAITRVDPTTSVQFDTKKYLDDFSQKHPKLFKKIHEQYDRVGSKKGYVAIKMKTNKDKN